MQEYILHSDCHPTKYSVVYQSRRSAGRLSEAPLYIFWGTMVTFEQRRCIASVVWFASFNCLPRYYWFLLVMCRNSPRLLSLLGYFLILQPAIFLSNQPRPHCWPTNCLSLCAELASTDDLSLPIWMYSGADKLYSRSNDPFCMKWFTIVLMQEHQPIRVLFWVFNLVSDVHLPKVSLCFSHSVSACRIRSTSEWRPHPVRRPSLRDSFQIYWRVFQESSHVKWFPIDWKYCWVKKINHIWERAGWKRETLWQNKSFKCLSFNRVVISEVSYSVTQGGKNK